MLQDLITAVRNARAEKGVEPSHLIEAHIQAGDMLKILEGCRDWLAALARLDSEKLVMSTQIERLPEESVPLVVGPLQAYLPLAGMVDREKEQERLEKELSSANAQIERLEGLLAGPFSERAPSEVVQGEREKLEGMRETASRLEEQLQALRD